MPEVIDYFGTGSDAGKNSFLSNFYRHNGWTVEHYFQAAKTYDPAWVAKILSAPTPGQAKKLGRQVPLIEGWDTVKLDVMRALLFRKFDDPVMATRLLDTGDAVLIEGNTWGDYYWGCVKKHEVWMGFNNLGKLLMEVRDVLRFQLVDKLS